MPWTRRRSNSGQAPKPPRPFNCRWQPDARPKSELNIRLTATSDDTSVAGGFNSASKTFTVIRE